MGDCKQFKVGDKCYIRSLKTPYLSSEFFVGENVEVVRVFNDDTCHITNMMNNLKVVNIPCSSIRKKSSE